MVYGDAKQSNTLSPSEFERLDSTTDYELTVLIPCLNEEKTISQAINEALLGLVKAGLRGEVLVVDNGSVDDSRSLAVDAGARVILAETKGYGMALHTGILSARSEWVIFGDADLSYDFTLIYRFLDLIRKNDNFDLILGSRLKGEIHKNAMPFLNRYLGTPALNVIIHLFFGMRTSDCNSGMRLIRKSFYTNVPMRAPGMEWASELLVKTHLAKGRFTEVPIHLRKDQRGRPPHLRRWHDGWRHLKTIVLLSPNRLLALPSFISLFVACFALLLKNVELALVFYLASIAGLLLAMNVKLLLHIDGVRYSKLISGLLKVSYAEYLLSIGLGLTSTSICLMFVQDSKGFILYFLMFLSISGILMALNSFFWGTIVTHRVRVLKPN